MPCHKKEPQAVYALGAILSSCLNLGFWLGGGVSGDGGPPGRPIGLRLTCARASECDARHRFRLYCRWGRSVLDHLITSRRNFLVRATAFTAAGAADAVPIVTVADAKTRVGITWRSLHKALCDLYPQLTFHHSARVSVHVRPGQFSRVHRVQSCRQRAQICALRRTGLER